MKRVVVLPAAIGDLDEIFDHTARTWSEQQAVRYLNQFEDEFSELARRSSPGKACLSPHRGLRMQLVGSHVVYFFVNGEEVTISHVLHSRMSPELHTF